jgi:uncharacterized protein (DUF2336 family)
MSVSASVIPELEGAIQHGSNERRTQMLRRLTALFADSAVRFNEDHVALFDIVLCRLVPEIDAGARAELSERLAPIANAPAGLMRKLASDGDIAVARPALKQSARLRDADLIAIASSKHQPHLVTIAGRRGIGEAVTDVLIQRGDAEVARSVADNQSARLSDAGFSELVRRAASDEKLAERIGRRADIPNHLLRDLLVRATAVMEQRLQAAARPEAQREVRRALDGAAEPFHEAAPARDYSAAQRHVFEMHQAGRLGEAELAAFADSKRFRETVAALSLLCGVPIEVADRLMNGERPDPVLILCKAAGYGWPTTRAIITSRPAWKTLSAPALDAAFSNFEKLSAPTAQRVVRFWQVRQPDDAA